MGAMRVCLEADNQGACHKKIVDGVFEAISSRLGDERKVSIPVMLRDESGAFRGGTVARLIFGDLYVDHIWVELDLRRQGYGRRILEEVERIGLERSGRWSFANTLLPDAVEFFVANGYEVFGELAGMPPGQTVTFLRKRLRQ